jgi:hypothetical protein
LLVETHAQFVELQPAPHEQTWPASEQLPLGGDAGHGGGGGHVRITQTHSFDRHVHSGPQLVPNVQSIPSDAQYVGWLNGGDVGHTAAGQPSVVHAHPPPGLHEHVLQSSLHVDADVGTHPLGAVPHDAVASV